MAPENINNVSALSYARFCITGLPRSRTAWLAALMCAHGVETFHEYPPFFDTLEDLGAWLYAGTEEDPHGYVDGFAIIHHAELLKEHFADHPIVIVQRNPAAVRKSWEQRDGPISDELFHGVVRKVMLFWSEMEGKPNVLAVPYDLLDSFDGVDRLVRHCTGRPLKYRTWQLFNVLKIELFTAKCRNPGKP